MSIFYRDIEIILLKENSQNDEADEIAQQFDETNFESRN